MSEGMTGKESGYDHLLHYLGREPQRLAGEIMRAVGAKGSGLQWRLPPGAEEPGADPALARWHGLDFLRPAGRVPIAWQSTWPQDRPPIVWDAVGRIAMTPRGWSWFMVCAFAHPDEMMQPLKEPLDPSSPVIAAAIGQMQHLYHVTPGSDWLNTSPYLTERLVAYGQQRAYGSCAQLLWVYLTDDSPEGASGCPTRDEWEQTIGDVERRMGLTGKSVAERNIHQLFLPVLPN